MARATLKSGLVIEYEDEGAGEPLVLIMGLGSQHVFWPPGILDELRSRGFRTLRFDNRDVGGSTWLTEAGTPSVPISIARAWLGLPVKAPYTLWDMADDVAGLLDVLGIPAAHVLGVSMGGMIAQCLAIRHPARVRTLVNIMAGPGGRLADVPRPRALAAITSEVPADPAAAIEREVGIFARIGSPGYPPDEALLRELLAAQVARGVNPPGFARQLVAVVATGNRTRLLRGLRVPTLVVHGAADPLVLPWTGRRVARAIPGARLLMLPGMGHDLPRPLWPVVADAVSSLASTATVPPPSR